MVLHRQILFSLAIAAIAEAILMWTSAEQVPSLYKVAPQPNQWCVKLQNASIILNKTYHLMIILELQHMFIYT